MLVFSQTPILEIALTSGYESQQAFTDGFKAMYKITPAEFREAKEFYPLQLEIHLNDNPRNMDFTKDDIRFAAFADMDSWMELVSLSIDEYPRLDESEYMEQLRQYIARRQALILQDEGITIGAMAFSADAGRIDFWAVHPQYRHLGITKLFLDKPANELLCEKEISLTTYRSGDKADTGHRKKYTRLGFVERELLVEYGYPTQRFVLLPESREDIDNDKYRNKSTAQNFNALSLIKFAFPSMVMMLFMGLYTIVDTLFVARFVDTNALSSIHIVCPVIHLIVGLGTMLATGGSAVVASKMGNRQSREARSNFTLIILTGIIIGLVITIIGLLFLDEITWGLGAGKILFSYCKDYLRIQLIFAVGNILQVLYQNLFVTAGKPALGLILSILAGVANIVFDFVFIVLLKMGIEGAALGTGIGMMIPALSGTIFFLTGRSELHFCQPAMDISVLFKSCSNGFSEMVSQLSTAVTTFLFNAAMMNLLGEDGVAAITVLIYSEFLLTTVYIGFSMGVAPVISYNYGSKNIRQLQKIVRICFCFIINISLFVFLASFFAGTHIAELFAGNNRTVFEITRTGFSLFSFGFLFSGCNIFGSAFFTALSNGKISAAISFLRTFGFITIFLLVLPVFWGVTGVWSAIPLAELLTFLLTICLLITKKRCTKNAETQCTNCN